MEMHLETAFVLNSKHADLFRESDANWNQILCFYDADNNNNNLAQ